MLDRPADDTGAPHWMLAFDGAFAPERVEERNERQAEDREIVALDLFEQLNAESLELIGADRAEDILAGGGEVAADELGRQLSHGERRHRRLRPDGFAIGDDGDGGVKRMPLAAEIEQ